MNTPRRNNNLIGDSDSPVLFLIEDEHEREESVDSPFNAQPVQKRKTFIKKFRKEWLDEPIFAGWLQQIPDVVEKCYCAACRVVLHAGHSELEKHAAGKKHCLALETYLAENCLATHEPMDPSKMEMDPTLRDLGDSAYELGAAKELKLHKTSSDGLTNVPTKMPGLKRKPTQGLINSKLNIPTRPDAAKLIRLMKSEPDEDDLFYNEEEEEEELEGDDAPSTSEQVLNEIRAELAFSEKELIQRKQKERLSQNEAPIQNGRIPTLDDAFQNIAERELEARLNLVEERRRQQLNIFKLKLFEMEAKVKLAETAIQQNAELHNLRLTQLHLQLQKEQASIIIPEVDESEPPQ